MPPLVLRYSAHAEYQLFNRNITKQSAEHTIRHQAAVTLEFEQRSGRVRSEDSIDLAGVETEHGKSALQVADVVTALLRCRVKERALAQRPTRLDQRHPGLIVAFPVRP